MAGADRTSPNLTNSVTPQRLCRQYRQRLKQCLWSRATEYLQQLPRHRRGRAEQPGRFPSGGGEINSVGFDYDPAFGGVNGSNKTGSYVFKALTSGSLSASLVWNLAVNGATANGFDTTATLYHLGLYLYDTTSSSELAYATSLVDNTENIWYTSLTAGDYYTCLRLPPCSRPISSGTTAWPGILRQPPPTPPCPPLSISWAPASWPWFCSGGRNGLAHNRLNGGNGLMLQSGVSSRRAQQDWLQKTLLPASW